MNKIELQTENREVLGKKVKILRQQKLTPVHVFGHGQNSLALQSATGKLEHVLAQAGETRLINLVVGEEKKTHPVLVREVQRDSINGQLLHVDFYEVRMDEKVQVEIPIILVGEAPALKIKGVGLNHELNTLTVECLPDAIPNKIEVDMSNLMEPGNAVHVKDLKPEVGITFLNHADQTIVVITAARVERAEEVVKEAAPAAEAAEGAEAKSGEEAPKAEKKE
jgi:large subunit ribosomal protein L25